MSSLTLYIHIYIWLGPLRSTPKPNTALKSSWSDLQAAKESGGILECLKIENIPWSGPKTILADTRTPTKLTTLTNRTQWKCAWGARKCWNSKIWSNFDSKFYLKTKLKKFAFFKVLQFFAVFHYFFRPRLSATGVSIWLGCSKNDGRHGFREISTRNSMKTRKFEIFENFADFRFFHDFSWFSMFFPLTTLISLIFD